MLTACFLFVPHCKICTSCTLCRITQHCPTCHPENVLSMLILAAFVVQPSKPGFQSYYSPFWRKLSTWTSVSQYQNDSILDFVRMVDAVVIAGATTSAKLQSNSHHQQTNTQSFSHAGCPSCRPTNSVTALKESIRFHGDAHPSSSGGLWTLSLTPKGSRLPWGRVDKPLVSPLMPVPTGFKSCCKQQN